MALMELAPNATNWWTWPFCLFTTKSGTINVFILLSISSSYPRFQYCSKGTVEGPAKDAVQQEKLTFGEGSGNLADGVEQEKLTPGEGSGNIGESSDEDDATILNTSLAERLSRSPQSPSIPNQLEEAEDIISSLEEIESPCDQDIDGSIFSALKFISYYHNSVTDALLQWKLHKFNQFDQYDVDQGIRNECVFERDKLASSAEDAAADSVFM